MPSLKRRVVKAHRKVFGKPTEIGVTTGKGGLTKAEMGEVIATLGKARREGKVPDMTYEHKPILLWGREPLYLKSKTGTLANAMVKMRGVLQAKFGNRIKVNKA